VEALAADLAEAPGILPLANADAVLSSALCDLVSRPWLDRMAAALRVPFYAALCVDGRERFIPPHPLDARILAGFRRDQGRDKGFGGVALGPRAPAAIAAAFGARGFGVASAASDWVVRQRGPSPLPGLRQHGYRFISELVLGHSVAARRHDHRGGRLIGAWTEARLNQIADRRLAVRIGHRDLLAVPPRP
jgi:hypothetical protein